MTHNTPSKRKLIKFYVPPTLSDELQMLAQTRNIARSALLRLIVTEYVRRRQDTVWSSQL